MRSRIAQRDGAELCVECRAQSPGAQVHGGRRMAQVGDRERPGFGRPRSRRGVELAGAEENLRTVGPSGSARRNRLRRQDGPVGIDEATSLLVGRVTEIVGRADQDLLDERRRR